MQKAFILINCDLGSEANLIKELNQLDAVKEVHGILGPYDIVTTIETDNQDKIRKTISDHIRKLEHIRSTITLMRIEDLQPLPDIIPDVIPGEKKPLEPPDEVNDEEYDDDEDEEDFSDKNRG